MFCGHKDQWKQKKEQIDGFQEPEQSYSWHKSHKHLV